MKTDVSRFTNAPLCSSCQRRPKRWSGGRWQAYCTECHREYGAQRRSGMVEVLLTPQEWAMIQLMRNGAG